MLSYEQEWHHNEPWMMLPPCGTETWAMQLTDGATCWAASEEVDGAKRAKFHSLCASKTEGIKDNDRFANCLNGIHRSSRSLRRFRTEPASQELHTHEILSIGDFCKVAASTFSEAVPPDQFTTCQKQNPVKVHPFGQWVCPSRTVTKLVTVEVLESTHVNSWVYGRTAGMLYTMHLLENEWNRTLHRVQRFDFSSQDNMNQGQQDNMNQGQQDTSANSVDGILDGLFRNVRVHQNDPHAVLLMHRTHARTIPNFLGPIGPNQPPAKPWDVSRYDILLDVADQQRVQGLLTEQQHTQVSEELVLAGRFHREHAAFENTLQPEWVDSLHTVLEHPVVRKIFVWKLKKAGLNVSIAAQFANVRYYNLDEKIKVASALNFDLCHPLSTSERATEGESVVGADDLAEFVALI